MNIGEAHRLVKGLVGEDDFHDVEDILSSYYHLAQLQIATTAAPIQKQTEIQKGITAPLPEDLFRLTAVEGSYTRPDKKHIFIEGSGACHITYYAYPQKIYDDSPDDTEFEVPLQAQTAIPYYAAAQVVLSDSDMTRYYAFMDTFNGILTNVAEERMQSISARVVKTEEMR